MPDEHKRPLSDSLRRMLGIPNRGKETPSNPGDGQAAEPPAPEPTERTSPLGPLSLQELLRYANVLVAAAAVEASELDEAQAEVDRRLVDAQQDAEIESLQDAARRLQRRRLQLEAERNAAAEYDRLLGQAPRYERPDDDDWGNMGGVCMCSLAAPDDEPVEDPANGYAPDRERERDAEEPAGS